MHTHTQNSIQIQHTQINTASPLVYNYMGWLGDGSHRGQGCQAWTAVGLPPRYHLSTTELCKQLHWLPIRQQITYKIAVTTYKTRTTGTPAYLSHLIQDYQPHGTLWSTDKLLLPVPRMVLCCRLKPSALVLLQSGAHCCITVVLQNCSVHSGLTK